MLQTRPVDFFDNEAECLRLINSVLKGEQDFLLVRGPGRLVFRVEHTGIICIESGTTSDEYLSNTVSIEEGMILDASDFFKIIMFLAHNGSAGFGAYNKFCW